MASHSDYRGFAAEKPEELAQAIQMGIPSTLRGMMWQHMSFTLLASLNVDSTSLLDRAASKDLELETTYLKLLKETSTYEKSITRDLGRRVLLESVPLQKK